jgi:hypothetical protein
LLIKKVDVKSYFAARRGLRLGAAWPMSQLDAAGHLKAVPSGTKAGAEEFVKELSVEHSFPSVSVTLAAGNSGNSQAPTVARSPQA